MLLDALRVHDSTRKVALSLKRATFATQTWSPSTAAAHSNDASLSERASMICQRTLCSRPRRACLAYFVHRVHRTKNSSIDNIWRMWWCRPPDELKRAMWLASGLILPTLIVLIVTHSITVFIAVSNPMNPNATLIDEISGPKTPREGLTGVTGRTFVPNVSRQDASTVLL